MLRIIICLMFERPLQRYSVPLRLYQQEYCTWENTLCVVAVPVHADGPTDFYSIHLKTSYLRHGLVQDESTPRSFELFSGISTHPAVFFSHHKPANSTFSHNKSAKRIGCKSLLGLAIFMIDLPHGTKNISYISQDGESEYSVQIL
jgi:hypothetical protein